MTSNPPASPEGPTSPLPLTFPPGGFTSRTPSFSATCGRRESVGGTVFMALGFGFGLGRIREGEREARGYEPFTRPYTWLCWGDVIKKRGDRIGLSQSRMAD